LPIVRVAGGVADRVVGIDRARRRDRAGVDAGIAVAAVAELIVGAVLRLLDVSLLTRPLYDAVSVGGVPP